ncbi:MAG: hypothetical protein AB7O97_23345 [Planctomycetota bacterium]
MLENVVASLLAAFLFTGAGMAIQWWRYRSTKAIRVFEPNKNGTYHEAFYTHFRRQIERARHDILITGEGFEYKTQVGEDIAEAFHLSIRKALESGVEVTRLQSRANMHPRWAAHLRELLDEFPKRFHLYLVGSGKTQVASYCIIDADTRRSVVELMISGERHFGDSTANLAQMAVFFHGTSELAKVLGCQIHGMKRGTSPCTATSLDKYLTDAS